MQRRDVRSSSARSLAWLLVAPFAFVECSCSAEDAMVSRLCQSAIALYGAWPSPAQRSSRIPTRYTWVHTHGYKWRTSALVCCPPCGHILQ